MKNNFVIKKFWKYFTEIYMKYLISNLLGNLEELRLLKALGKFIESFFKTELYFQQLSQILKNGILKWIKSCTF